MSPERRATRRVLVVEDEPALARLVSLHLGEAGHEVTVAGDGAAALVAHDAEPFDLVVLDRMLPDLDGIEICRRLRRGSATTPILMLTALTSTADHVEGLEAGADDYLDKPFSVAELVARVQALFRRVDALSAEASEASEAGAIGGSGDDPEPVAIGELDIDPVRRRVEVSGEAVHLTAKEFDLLWHLASSPGRVFTRAQLLDQVWGYSHAGYEHTVNSHINRLRSKIESDPSEPAHVLTVWGVGYRFVEPGEGA